MSSARFNRLVRDAYANDDINGAIHAYSEYQQTHCLHPRLQEVTDSHTQTRRKILVSCGRCFHCMQSKINEWCTRMYAHAEDFKNVYFITLTYRSFRNCELQLNKLIMSRLSQAVWHRDAYNYTHHMSYNPCVLCKDHYQKFLKRLRKNTGLKDITYVISGEYGSKYGRPHFHAILFTNGVLTKADIVRAWSVCLWRKDSGEFIVRTSQKNHGSAYDFPIGRVDFNDLVSNGTFNTTAKIRIDGTYMNACNCFSYVAKYVVKRESVNMNRVHMAYDNLFHKEQFVNVFDNEFAFNKVKDYLLSVGYSFESAENLYNNQLKQLSYEKIIYDPTKSVFVDGLLRYRAHQINGFEYNEELLPQTHHEFCDLFRPFCEFSRGTPIGSVYAKRNISEFAQDVFTKPLLQESGFVVPSYFRTKARHYLYGLRKVRTTMSGKSFVYSGLVDLHGRLHDSLVNYTKLCESIPDTDNYQLIKASLQSDFTSFVDIYSGERIILNCGFAQHYKYDRKDKSFHLTRYMKISDWIRYWCDSLSRELERHQQLTRKAVANLRDRESAILILTDMGQPENVLSQRYEENQKALYQSGQKLYNELHNSVE